MKIQFGLVFLLIALVFVDRAISANEKENSKGFVCEFTISTKTNDVAHTCEHRRLKNARNLMLDRAKKFGAIPGACFPTVSVRNRFCSI